MKYMNAIVSVIIAAAVLIAAYAIGLLVRRARIPDSPPGTAAAPNEVTTDPRMALPLPGRIPARSDDAEARATIRQQQEELLAKSKNMTEEEKQQFREQIRSRVTPPGARRRLRGLSEEDRERMLQSWQNMSPQQREALDFPQRPQEAPADTHEGDSGATEQGTEGDAAEPNEPNRVEP